MGMMDQLKGMMGGAPSGNSTGVSLTSDSIYAGLKSAGYSVLNVVVYGAFVAGVVYLMYRYMVFNKKVMLKVMRENIVVDIKIKSARIYKEKKTGVMRMKVMGVKMLQEVPPEKFKQRRGKLDFYEGVLDVNGTIQWIEQLRSPEDKKMLLEPDPSDKKVWRSYEEQILIERFSKPSAWDKYKDIIIPLAAFILAFLITFFFFKDVAKGMEAVGGGMNTQAEAFKEMAKQCGSLLN